MLKDWKYERCELISQIFLGKDSKKLKIFYDYFTMLVFLLHLWMTSFGNNFLVLLTFNISLLLHRNSVSIKIKINY